MDNAWLVAVIPNLATGALGYAAARLAHRAKKEEVDTTASSQVQIARIEAGTATESHLWQYLNDANARHEADLLRLGECNDQRREAEAQVVVLRSRLAAALRRVRTLEKKP